MTDVERLWRGVIQMQNSRRFGVVVLIAALVALPALDVRAQAKKKPDVPLAGDKIDSAKWVSGTYSGKLKSTPNSDRVFDLEIMAPGGKWVVVEFQLTEKVKVRTMVLPEAFDDKGNPKKYTKKELSDLKGADKVSPGYESSVEKLGAGQTVQLTLAAVARPAAPTGKKKEKEDDGDGLKDTVFKSKQVKMVVIITSPEGSEGGPAVPKKKK